MATSPAQHDGKAVTPAGEHAVGHADDSGAPEKWGWHGEWGRSSRIGGWFSLIVLLLMILPSHYNGQGTLFLSIAAALLFVTLLWDRQRRKHSWRQ